MIETSDTTSNSLAQTGYAMSIEGLLDHYMETILNTVELRVRDNSFELDLYYEWDWYFFI